MLLIALTGVSRASAQTSPVPLINQPPVPVTVAPGAAGFTLTIRGTEFTSGSTVNWNASARSTTFVSSSVLKASILASDVASVGTASITVSTPAPGGGTSNVVYFQIAPPAPTSFFAYSQSLLTVNQQAKSVAVGDLNGDGIPDLVAIEYGGPSSAGSGIPAPGGSAGADPSIQPEIFFSESSISVFLGNGDGTFGPRTDYTIARAIEGPQSVVIGDFNGDGKPDIAVDGTVLLGNGDGTFTFAASLYTCTVASPVLSVTGDFNGDGKLDLAITGSGVSNTGVVDVCLGNGDGTFAAPIVTNTGSGAFGMAVGDFNGDGKPDLALAVGGTPGLSVLLGNGDGTFQASTNYLVPYADTVVTADFNGDGILDLAVGTEGGFSVLLGRGDGTFGQPLSYTVSPEIAESALVLGDFNADGKIDLAVEGGELSIYLGNGDGTFVATPAYSSVNLGLGVEGMATADFNGDGRLDFVAANNEMTTTVGVFLQVFDPIATLSTSSLSFGNQIFGTSASQNVTVSNTGNEPLAFTSFAISGTTSSFMQTDTCPLAPQTLALGATCTVQVSFSPTIVGPILTGTLTIGDNSLGGAQTVQLSGSAVAATRVVSLSASSLTFATTTIGLSTTQTFSLSNMGNAPLTVSSVVVGGTNSGDFTESDNCAGSVATGGSCTINIAFAPTAAGTRTATVTIADNATSPSSPQTITLTGTGQGFSIATSSPSSVSIAPGGMASYSIVVSPSGGFSQSVSFTCSGAPAQASCAVSPSSAVLNGSAPATVMVTVMTVAGALSPPRGPLSMGGRWRSNPIVLLAEFLLLLGSLGWYYEPRTRSAREFAPILLVCAALVMYGCGGGGGGGGNQGTPAGNYTIVVSANFTSGSVTVTHTTNLSLVVQ